MRPWDVEKSQSWYYVCSLLVTGGKKFSQSLAITPLDESEQSPRDFREVRCTHAWFDERVYIISSIKLLFVLWIFVSLPKLTTQICARFAQRNGVATQSRLTTSSPFAGLAGSVAGETIRFRGTKASLGTQYGRVRTDADVTPSVTLCNFLNGAARGTTAKPRKKRWGNRTKGRTRRDCAAEREIR